MGLAKRPHPFDRGNFRCPQHYSRHDCGAQNRMGRRHLHSGSPLHPSCHHRMERLRKRLEIHRAIEPQPRGKSPCPQRQERFYADPQRLETRCWRYRTTSARR